MSRGMRSHGKATKRRREHHLLANKLMDHMILSCICVLELIHEDMGVCRLVALQEIGAVSQEGHNTGHEVIIVKLAAVKSTTLSAVWLHASCRGSRALPLCLSVIMTGFTVVAGCSCTKYTLAEGLAPTPIIR